MLQDMDSSLVLRTQWRQRSTQTLGLHSLVSVEGEASQGSEFLSLSTGLGNFDASVTALPL